MGLNVEIKARYDDLETFQTQVIQLPVTFEGEDIQIDTFFNVKTGRLKLRESLLYGNLLIPYLRPDQTGPKQADYELIKISDPKKLKFLFDEILGIYGTVRKKRRIYLFENVRIHLDAVENLGSFIEFEAVVDDAADIKVNEEKINWLLDYFKINKDQLINVAYMDLLQQL
ncbi:MAG: class IV adenylate cyclase [Calditrichaceae bacterium]|jgi:adenylate cyclase, class 2